MNELYNIELSGTAVDRASLRILPIWRKTRREQEGIYTWLQRMALEALENGKKIADQKYRYKEITFVIQERGTQPPYVKTVSMANKRFRASALT